MFTKINRIYHTAIIVLIVLSLSACANSGKQRKTTLLDKLSLYQPTVVQGNFVARENLATITRGMSKEEVQYYLGTPLLIDLFSPDKWYYSFLLRDKKKTINYNVKLTFTDNSLADIKADMLPRANDALDIIQPKKIKGKAVKTKLSEKDEEKILSKTKSTAVPNEFFDPGEPNEDNIPFIE